MAQQWLYIALAIAAITVLAWFVAKILERISFAHVAQMLAEALLDKNKKGR